MSEWFNAKCNRKVRTGFKRPITGRTPTRIRGPQFKPRTTRSTNSCYNFGRSRSRSCTRTQTPLQTFCLKSAAAIKHNFGGDRTHIVSNSHALLFTRTSCGWGFASASSGLQTWGRRPPTFSTTTSPQSVLPVLPTTCRRHRGRCVFGNFHFRFERGRPLRTPTNHYPALQHQYRGLQSSGSHMQESFAQTCPCPYHDHEFEAAWHFVTSLWPLVTTEQK